jgi:hypothetical protein
MSDTLLEGKTRTDGCGGRRGCPAFTCGPGAFRPVDTRKRALSILAEAVPMLRALAVPISGVLLIGGATYHEHRLDRRAGLRRLFGLGWRRDVT